MSLGDHALEARPQCPAAGGYRAADLSLGDRGTVLARKTLVDPLGGVALLRWRGEVGTKPAVNQLEVGAELGGRSALGALARWRKR